MKMTRAVGKVYVGVIDGRLVALDAATGRVAWETVTVDQSQPYTVARQATQLDEAEGRT